MGTEDVDQVREALGHLPAKRFSPARIEALRAWMAARRGDAAAERQALDSWSGSTPATEPRGSVSPCLRWRLAGERTRAACGRRKAAIDEARQRYKDLYNDNHFAQDSAELARQAEALGGRFEAIGFLTWLARHEPFNQDARDALARLQRCPVREQPAGPRSKPFRAPLGRSCRGGGRGFDADPALAPFLSAAVPG